MGEGLLYFIMALYAMEMRQYTPNDFVSLIFGFSNDIIKSMKSLGKYMTIVLKFIFYGGIHLIKIGILCAGDRELAPFLPHIQNCKESKKAMLKFYEGTINNVDIVTLYSGVCKTNAAVASQILIDNYNVDLIINAGTAGGMDSKLEIFDTVITTEVAHHDVNEDILTEFHPWMPSIYFRADETLLKLSQQVAKHFMSESDNAIYFGRTITGEKFITDHGRDEINSFFCPLSVDMETASIAQVCYVNSIPFIAIRTLTDTATHSGGENFDKNCDKASTISKDIVLELLNKIKNYY